MIVPFPTDRKRKIAGGWLNRHRVLPENVVVFEKPERPSRLSRSPELLLLMAMMKTMDGAHRWRLAQESKALAEQAERRGDVHAMEVTEDLLGLHYALSCHIER